VFYEPAYTGCTLCALQKPINYSCSSSETSSEQRLDSIKCSNGEFVRLSYSTRLDLTGAFKLDSVIHGYNYSGPVNVKKWNLTYNYFDNTSSNQDSLRLKLVKVAVSSLDDSISENYSMVYDSTILPGRLSYAVDSFGFYNGVDTNTTYLTNIANRKLSNTYVSAGSLKRIYYPTGGYSVFQYGLNRIVGGNQVESITDYDGYGNVSNYRSYVYKYAKSASTKFYDQFTSHVTTTNNQQNTIGCSSPEFQVCNNTGSDWIWGYQCPYYRYKSSPAVLPVYSTFTDNAKYDSVYEYFGANGQNGYKLYVLGFPKNRAASAYMGIDNQVVKTNIYKLGSDNNYYIINSKVDSLMVLPQADTNYFNAPYDVRQQYTYGAISELDRDELTTTCGTSSSNCMPRVILQNYCYLSSSPLYKTMTINTDYAYNGSSIDSLKTVINYSYSGLPQYNPIVITTTNSKGEVYSENKKFVADIVTGGPHSSVYDSMAVNNRLSQEIIDSVVKEPGQKISLTKTNFDFVGGSIIQPVLVQQSIGPNPLNDIITVSLYDAKGNMVQGKGRDGINITYLYGYNYTYVIAKIIGADYTQVMTKLSSLGATNDIRYTALQSITDENSLRATLASLRIINNAFATVYTYLPYVGISSETNSNGYTTYYEYDKLGRLFLIKDKDKNIIKKYCYNYAGQPESCSVYWNNTKSKDFDKSNCSYPNVGTTVTYTVSSHTYYSTISTAAADTMALHDININGQHYADSLGTCFLPTIYARIEYTDYYNDGTTTTATVLIKFYYDSGCTKPYSINNLNVNYKYVTSNCDGSSTITLNNSQLCSGFQYSLGTQTLYIDDGFVCKNYDYSVTAGTGYVAK
ncbi:MAG TPA: DUF5977 domain-containing protein, partial [Flavisolibacter sp.]|nr:DUF5977 domain-containing protein [Flavisolibacter sp.]